MRRLPLQRKTSESLRALEGVIDEAEYEGELAEFVPYLVAAYWTGVGKHTVWGKGVVRLLEVG